nr:hypothetical protein [Candidatus Sigynarchaeum springense]MDO8116651.1 hypothetical protein [Candidatus Sigynarchaeota archaeon]
MSSQKIEDLEDDFNNLTREIADARAKRDEFNGTTHELIHMIKEHNSKIKEHLKKAQELKEKRDSFNENVQAAKNNRVTTQIALEELRKKLNEIRDKNKEIPQITKDQQAQIKKLRNAVRARNMEIETAPSLSPQEEDRLIKEIEEMEGKLGELTKGSDARREYGKVIAQFPAYKMQLKKYHDEVILNSQESQKYHELMLKEYQAVDALREKISSLEKELNDNRKKADQYHAQLLGYYKKRDGMRDEIMSTQREIRVQRRKERGNVAILLRRLAKERMERGEKLDYIAFRLLLEKGEVETEDDEESPDVTHAVTH